MNSRRALVMHASPVAVSYAGELALSQAVQRKPAVALRLTAVGTLFRAFEFPLARLVRRGKITGNRLCYLAGGRPFAATDERDDEADAFLRIVAVPHRRVEDASLAVIDRDDHRLVVASAPLGRIGECRGQDVHVFAGAAELVVELVVDVHPLAGHAFGDRMLGVANDDLKRMLGAMVASA